MRNEMPYVVDEAHWGQERVTSHGRLTRIDRQHESFQNAHNTLTSAESHSASLVTTIAAKSRVIPSAEERWGRPKVVGNLGGNVFGGRLGSTEKSAADSRGKVLLFAGLVGAPTQVRYETWLEDALEELKTCPDDAIDDCLDMPSELGLIKARALIMDLAIHVEARPDIYPMDQGSIAIDIRHPNGKVGVLCLIERDGSGALFSRSQKSKGRVRVDDAADLLVEGGLSEMRRLGIGL